MLGARQTWCKHKSGAMYAGEEGMLTYHKPIRSLQEADDVEWRPLLHARQLSLQSALHLCFLLYCNRGGIIPRKQAWDKDCTACSH